MKKKLLLITTRKDMMVLYLEELIKIFEGYLEIFSCCLQEKIQKRLYWRKQT